MADLCIIPARGGSKRIPKKNIKPFLGKPIIAYSIEAAIQSNLFSEVMVSTDCQETAEIALKYGATVPFTRSKENSNDFATTFDVIEEVIATYRLNNQEFDNLCCIYPCAPFVNDKILKKAKFKLDNEELTSVYPIIPFSFPIQRSLKIVENKIQMFNSDFSLTRSQDLESAYHDAGQFYWANTKNLLISKNFNTNNTGYVIISNMEGQDIDTLTDWKLAELKYQLNS